MEIYKTQSKLKDNEMTEIMEEELKSAPSN
jgi:hypothetical protein